MIEKEKITLITFADRNLTLKKKIDMGYYAPKEMAEAFRASGNYKGKLAFTKFMVLAVLGGLLLLWADYSLLW